MWKSCALMKPPSRMFTSWPRMVAAPLRPATRKARLSGGRQPASCIALACWIAT